MKDKEQRLLFYKDINAYVPYLIRMYRLSGVWAKAFDAYYRQARAHAGNIDHYAFFMRRCESIRRKQPDHCPF